MRVVMRPNQTLVVTFEDEFGMEQLDGQFTIEFDTADFPNRLVVRDSSPVEYPPQRQLTILLN